MINNRIKIYLRQSSPRFKNLTTLKNNSVYKFKKTTGNPMSVSIGAIHYA